MRPGRGYLMFTYRHIGGLHFVQCGRVGATFYRSRSRRPALAELLALAYLAAILAAHAVARFA